MKLKIKNIKIITNYLRKKLNSIVSLTTLQKLVIQLEKSGYLGNVAEM